MPLAYRPARAEELQQAQELVVHCINNLTERHGFAPMAKVGRPDFQLFSLWDDPDGLWVAEAEGEIVGFVLSWVCDDLWFLSELFIAPGYQGHGIGNELLAHSLEHARKAEALNRGLITFAFNVVSQSLYIRHGLLPWLPIYLVSIAREQLKTPREDAKLSYTPIEATPSHRDLLAGLDRSALGISREKHHRYLLGDASMRGVLFHDAAKCVGYAYISASGHVGPLAVAEARYTGAAFATALDIAVANGAAQLSAFVPGDSEASGMALERGMRIRFPMVLMSTRKFGDWTRYLPRIRASCDPARLGLSLLGMKGRHLARFAGEAEFVPARHHAVMH